MQYGAKFDSICDDYAKLIARNTRSPHIVFDGYRNGLTTKTQQMNKGQKV